MAANTVYYLPGAISSENWAKLIFLAAFADIVRIDGP
jgi:hypothetical protein